MHAKFLGPGLLFLALIASMAQISGLPLGICSGSGLGISLIAPAIAAESESHDRVMLVFVFDKSCRISCDRVRPVLLELEETYKDRLKVVELDISPEVLKETQKRADELGLKSFLANTEDWYPAVGIFDKKGKKVKEILGAQPKAKYVAAIEKAMMPK
ncbi:MAG: thioredoxin family protein [Cyanobacteria bacterium REEB67]|nr:thioredoxin family protein [Cyanobacteria bacterium REEB67]